MVHPLGVDALEENDTLHLTQLLHRVELGFLRLVKFDGLFLQHVLQLVLAHMHLILGQADRGKGDNGKQQGIQLCQIPVHRLLILGDGHIHRVLRDLRDHPHDNRAHVLAVQHLPALRIDGFTLLIHNLIVLQEVLTDAVVVVLDLLLGILDGLGQHLVLNLLSFRHAHGVKHIHQPLGTEQLHQVIFQGNVEAGFTRVSLTAGTSAQLVIDSSRLMALCADDLQSAQGSGLLVQLDIGTTAGHVGRDGHGAVYTGIGHDLRFHLMELRIQDFMRDASSLQHLA